MVVKINTATIVVTIPTVCEARRLLIEYQKSPESKHDQTISSQSYSLFYLVLNNKLSKILPGFSRTELSYEARKAWNSADQDFRDAYDLVLENEMVKKCLDD
ncbi:5681_t:CDS:1 [Funneliformis mosseae]|uniref:5681_t:CDS:1 n=1 Tax=Funneliformis mosseae TaxID=27381 RepID=A0A9N8VDT5_FUNMO|nr:5681_t:CDS:1 [Funneliformis mosseae]